MALSFTLSTAAGGRLQTLDVCHHWAESVASCSGIINTDRPLVTQMSCLVVACQIFFPFWVNSSATVPEEPFMNRVLMKWDISRGFLRFVSLLHTNGTSNKDGPDTLSCLALF